MKRFAALLTAFILLLSSCALAFEGVGYPEWDGTVIPESGLYGKFGEDRISLIFDPSADYSNTDTSIIQACFFAYDSTNENFLEMYLLIPRDAAPGDVLTTEHGEDCAIYLYENFHGSDIFYYAGGVSDSGPSGGSFELTIETVEATDSAITMSGQLRAELARYNSSAPGQTELLSVGEALFRFQLPLNSDSSASAPKEQPNPFESELPESDLPDLPDLSDSDASGPRFTLPPDYVSI